MSPLVSTWNANFFLHCPILAFVRQLVPSYTWGDAQMYQVGKDKTKKCIEVEKSSTNCKGNLLANPNSCLQRFHFWDEISSNQKRTLIDLPHLTFFVHYVSNIWKKAYENTMNTLSYVFVFLSVSNFDIFYLVLFIYYHYVILNFRKNIWKWLLCRRS